MTAVGDPNQAIYGWRGASVSNILGFAPPSRGRRRGPGVPLTVNRRSDRRVLEVANRLAAALYGAHHQVAPLEAAAGARRAPSRLHVHATHADELAWLADAVRAAHDGRPARAWSDVGVLVRDNAHAADVFDALGAAGVPVEIVGLSGPAAPARGRRGRRDPAPAARRHGQRLPAHPAHRTALGDRSARPEPARSSGPSALAGRPGPAPRAGVGGRRARRDRRRCRPRRGARRSTTRSAIPATPTTRREARERFALLAAELRTLRGARRASRCSTWCVAIIEASRRRRRARLGGEPGRRGAARQPGPVRQGRGRLPRRRRRRHPPGAAGLPDRRGRGGHGLDLATPTEADSVKLLTVHRAKGLEWRRVFLRGRVREPFPAHRSPRACGPPRPPCCRRRCAATPPTCRSSPAATRRRWTPTAGAPRPRGRARSCGSATSP